MIVKNLTDFLNGAISIYMFLIIIRIFMSWFSPEIVNNPKSVLVRLCDPYLNLFKKIGFTIGYIDFSPLIAIVTLIFAGNIIMQVGLAGKLSFGIILSFFITGIWTAASSLIFFAFIVAVIRLIILTIRPNAYSPVLTVMDSIIAPLSTKISSIFTKNNTASYTVKLIIFIIMMLAAYLFFGWAVGKLAKIVIHIPF